MGPSIHLVVLVGLLNVLVLSGLLLYASNAYVMVALHWRHRRDPESVPPAPHPWPAVTVQLPLYNERYVAVRLLEAAGRLDYPANQLEIQVLDDSTDDTPALVAEAAERLRARGLTVAHLRRDVRSGYKAGALEAGLQIAQGEFVAIFDADFVPPPGFLRETLAHFGPRVAAVQARWGHLNRSFSALTVAQSLGIDGHFGVEQPARARSGLFLNFNGTAGVWRAAAIRDAGGWAHDTLTEDLNLSYRAQLRGWRIVYRPEIVCPAELPVLVSGFKSQQRRWAKGSIQTAIKLLPALWRAPLPVWTRYQGTLHLTYYLIHPLLLASVLLALPTWALHAGGAHSAAGAWRGVVFSLATLGPTLLLAYAQCGLGAGRLRRLCQLPTLLVIGVGVALSTSLAVLSVARKAGQTFERTPKFGITRASDSWRGKTYAEGSARDGLAELGLGVYCVAATWLLVADGQWAVTPILSLYSLGFLVVGGLTVMQTHGAAGARALAARRRAPMRTAVLGLVLLAPVEATAIESRETLVAVGERLWVHSPDARNPVACATCHFDVEAVRGWARSFPKFRALPPPEARVMTLLQATAEAVVRHYRLSDPLAAATALTAYLTALGGDEPLTPGRSPGQPAFPSRLQALAASVRRGEGDFRSRCGACHEPGRVAPRLRGFPRARAGEAESLETYLEAHVSGPSRLGWSDAVTADLVAFLANVLAGGSPEAARSTLGEELR